MPDSYAVMGNPIAHSKSPQIHTAFAQQTGQDLTYKAILVERDGLEEAINTFRKHGGKGLNITLPFKTEAWNLVDECSSRAQFARAVNTITIAEDGTLLGDNTDGIGLIRDLTDNYGGHLQNQRILLLGAGGAASGVIAPLLAEKPALLVVVNRTPSKAHELAARFSQLGSIQGGGYELLGRSSFNFIINATASSLQGHLPPLPEGILKTEGWVYDMMYGGKPSIFMEWGQRQGAKQVLDGLGMLVEQAAEAFFIWRGCRPNTAPVLACLRKELVNEGVK